VSKRPLRSEGMISPCFGGSKSADDIAAIILEAQVESHSFRNRSLIKFPRYVLPNCFPRASDTPPDVPKTRRGKGFSMGPPSHREKSAKRLVARKPGTSQIADPIVRPPAFQASLHSVIKKRSKSLVAFGLQRPSRGVPLGCWNRRGLYVREIGQIDLRCKHPGRNRACLLPRGVDFLHQFRWPRRRVAPMLHCRLPCASGRARIPDTAR